MYVDSKESLQAQHLLRRKFPSNSFEDPSDTVKYGRSKVYKTKQFQVFPFANDLFIDFPSHGDRIHTQMRANTEKTFFSSTSDTAKDVFAHAISAVDKDYGAKVTSDCIPLLYL
jgi:hypothetical protein